MKCEIVEEYVLFAFVLFWLSEVQLCQDQYVHQTNSVLTMVQDISEKIIHKFSRPANWEMPSTP
jgi:hypothetical protein